MGALLSFMTTPKMPWCNYDPQYTSSYRFFSQSFAAI